jgi:hypothetical protein
MGKGNDLFYVVGALTAGGLERGQVAVVVIATTGALALAAAGLALSARATLNAGVTVTWLYAVSADLASSLTSVVVINGY